MRRHVSGKEPPAATREVQAIAASTGYNGLSSANELSGGPAMAITVEATYENGVLRLAEPLPLKEHEKVQVTVHPRVCSLADAHGIMGWTGDAETLERIALEPEFLAEESL
jgi:predicted DNA-binding antitoxin AbrB/MazE fold protein